MTPRHRSKSALTDLQQAILDVLWSQGPATSEEIREALLPRHPLKDPSVRTLLRRLEARGFVSHRTDGKVFVYRAAEARRGVAARAVRQIIERFWSGVTLPKTEPCSMIEVSSSSGSVRASTAFSALGTPARAAMV